MSSKKPTTGQPGAATNKQAIAAIIRVNQAGEYGAKRIYAGQMAVLKNSPIYKTIKHMAAQEDEHLEYFSSQLARRHIRPTALMPVWHVAGYALGAITAIIGPKAAMACTVAVEEVIDEHYSKQIASLGKNEDELKEKIEKFRAEELEHRDTALENNATDAAGYPVLYQAVRSATKFAIFLSKRI